VKIHKITVKAASVCEHKPLSPTSMLYTSSQSWSM
jgi:hypothetical protein